MAAVFLGPTTIGQSVVGLNAAFDSVGSALTNLRNVVNFQLSAIATAVAALEAQGDAVLVAKAAIRIPAVGELQASLDASLGMGVQLEADLGDPSAYLSGLLTGLASVEASLGLSLPSVQLGLQVDANLAISAGLSLKIEAIDLQLEALVSINVALVAIVQALLAIQVALSAAISAVASALTLYVSMTATLATAGAYCVLYDGPLSGLGAAVDLVTPSTGLSGSTVIRCPLIIVQTADLPAYNGLNAVFKVS